MSESEHGMLARLLAGDIRALARAVSMVEDRAHGAAELVEACAACGKRARRIGLTGPPGAGKSTLADAIVRHLRTLGETVAVLAVDPSSPVTGGALLGDRIRMQNFHGDPGVYIRSMASRGALGGVAAQAEGVCTLMEASGFSTVIVETVGVGQDEVGVSALADVTVLVLVPGLGDDVQSLKAGIMEVADVYVVNKSDLPGAQTVEREIVAMQSLAMSHADWVAPVVQTVGPTGQGIAELLAAVELFLSTKVSAGTMKTRPTPEPANTRLDHLGIAVHSIDQAKSFYALLGMSVTHEETVEHEQVRTAMLPMGESRVELLEPTVPDSTIGRYLAKRGEGLHHIALHVEGVDRKFAEMQSAGIRLASDQVRIGAGGHRYFFIHPASTGGVLIELVGD